MPSRFESSLATLSRSSVFMLFGQTTILYAVAFLASTTPVESSIFPRVALSIVFLVCCDSARPASSSPSITIIFTSLMLSTKNNPHIMPSIIFSRFLLEMPGASKAAPSFMFYQPPHSVLCKGKPFIMARQSPYPRPAPARPPSKRSAQARSVSLPRRSCNRRRRR